MGVTEPFLKLLLLAYPPRQLRSERIRRSLLFPMSMNGCWVLQEVMAAAGDSCRRPAPWSRREKSRQQREREEELGNARERSDCELVLAPDQAAEKELLVMQQQSVVAGLHAGGDT